MAFMISLDYILEAFGAMSARRETGLSLQQNIFTDRSKRYFFCGSFVLSMLCVCHVFMSVYCCLVVT